MTPYIRKRTPALMLRLDRWLLLHYPVIWSYKWHYLLAYQLVIGLLAFLASWTLPVTSGNITDEESIATPAAIALGLTSVFWLLLYWQFDVRRRFAGKNFQVEFGKVLGPLWAMFFVVLLINGTNRQIWQRTSNMAPNDSYTSIAAIDDTVGRFEDQYRHLLNGYYITTEWNSKLQKQDTTRHPVSKAETLRAFEQICALNQQYGDGKDYTAAALMALCQDDNNWIFHHYSKPSSSKAILGDLEYNTDKISRAKGKLIRAHVWDDLDEILGFIAMITFLILALSEYYQRFNIRGLVSGVLAVGIASLVVFIFGLLFHSSYTDQVIAILLTLAIVALAAITQSGNTGSTQKLFLYQCIPVFALLLIAFTAFQLIRDWYYCIEYSIEGGATIDKFCDEAREKRHLAGVILFTVTNLLFIPGYFYGLYRLYRLPQK